MSRIILPHIITDDSTIGGSVIERSLVNAEGRSRYLTYTPSVAGDQRTFTLSGWFKLYVVNDNQQDFIWMCGGDGNNRFQVSREGVEQINFEPIVSGSTQARFYTSNKFNDPTAWYHFVFKIDTTQGTASDRYNFYINGVETEYGGTGGEVVTTSYPSQNTQFLWGSTIQHNIGRRSYGDLDEADMGIAELHYTSGYAYDATAFGYFDDQTGIWKPKKFTGSYGSAGWHLDFSDTTSTTTLGYDKSGNGNHWTLNNYSTDNAILDTPTNNFPVWNPTTVNMGQGGNGTLTNGNLEWLGTSGNAQVIANLAVESGKWYYEVKVGQNPSTFDCGWTTTDEAARDRLTAMSYYNLVGIRSGKTISFDTNPTVVSYTTNDIIGLALNLDDNLLYMYKNGSLLHTQSVPTDKGDTFIPMCGDSDDGNHASGIVNFGQDSSFTGDVTKQGNKDANGIGDFYYPVPSGYKALCSVNLPPTVSSVIRPQRHFNTVLYTGNGGTSQTISGIEFKPDLIWFKGLNHTAAFVWLDSVRGVTKNLRSNSNAQEGTTTAFLTSFNEDGFTVGQSGTTNGSGETNIAYCWKGGGAAVSNSDGTITTSISANQEAGFSIVTYTGTGSAATIGHGLGKVPKLVITKLRDTTTQDWFMNFGEITGDRGKYVKLNSTNAEVSETTVYPNTASTSTVYSVGTDNSVNGSGSSYVAYCWSEVPGYSKFGTYEGVDDGDGPYVYLGFRPAFLFIRRRQGEDTVLFDTKTQTRNEIGQSGRIYLDLDNSQGGTTKDMDFHSSGFKLRKNTGIVNDGAGTFMYMAIAEKPDLTPYNAVPTAKS